MLAIKNEWEIYYHKNNLNSEFNEYLDYYKDSIQSLKKILVIEDDYLSFLIIQSYINQIDESIRCFFATNAEDAVGIMSEIKCDAVISDINLENEKNGITICSEISKGNPHANILLISSMDKEHYLRLLEPNEVAPEFFEKPISKEKLKLFFKKYNLIKL